MFGSKLKRFARTYDEGEVIYREGDTGDSIIIIDEGRVQITKKSGGVDRVITTVGPGEFIGEMALAHGSHQRTATVTVIEEVSGWKLSKKQFESIIEKNDQFRHKLIQAFVKRLSETTEKYSREQEKDPLLLQLSFQVLSQLNMEEWDDPESQKKLPVEVSTGFLAYHFGTSTEIAENYRSFLDGKELADFDPETAEKLIRLGQRVIDESVQKIQPEFSLDEESDDLLVDSVREAQKYLNTLDEEGGELDRHDLGDIREDLKQFKDVLDQYREEAPGTFLVQKLEMLVESIGLQLKKLHRQ